MSDCCPAHLQPTAFTVMLGDVEFVPTPPGLTAAEAQHRLATWQGLRTSVDRLLWLIESEYAIDGGHITADARAALDAADRETP